MAVVATAEDIKQATRKDRAGNSLSTSSLCYTVCTLWPGRCIVYDLTLPVCVYCVILCVCVSVGCVSPVWGAPAPSAACWGLAPGCPAPCAGTQSPFSAVRRGPTAWPPPQPDWREEPGPGSSLTSGQSRGRLASAAVTSARPPAAKNYCCSRDSWGRWRCWCESRRLSRRWPGHWLHPDWWRCGGGHRTWAGPGSDS